MFSTNTSTRLKMGKQLQRLKNDVCDWDANVSANGGCGCETNIVMSCRYRQLQKHMRPLQGHRTSKQIFGKKKKTNWQ
jgi:hypothetical protein